MPPETSSQYHAALCKFQSGLDSIYEPCPPLSRSLLTLIPIYGLLLPKPSSLTGHSPPLDDEGVFLEALPLVADVLLATAPLLDEGVLPLPLLPPPPVEFGVFLCAGLYSGSESSSELRSSDESSGLRKTKKYG